MSDFGDGTQSFEERQSQKTNLAEELFKRWAVKTGISVYRLGFDEKAERLPQAHFNLLPGAIRKLPDFVAIGKDRRIVEVKGTPRFKRIDYELIDERVRLFHTAFTPLFFAFCFRGQEPIWKTPEEVKMLYEAAPDEKWDDGVVFRYLRLS